MEEMSEFNRNVYDVYINCWAVHFGSISYPERRANGLTEARILMKRLLPAQNLREKLEK